MEIVLAPNYLQPGCCGMGTWWRSIRHTAKNVEYLILWEFSGEFRDVMKSYEASMCVSNQKMKGKSNEGSRYSSIFQRENGSDGYCKFSTGGSGDFIRKHRAKILLFKMVDL